MQLKKTTKVEDGPRAVRLQLVPEQGDDELFAVFATNMQRVVRDLVGGTDVLLRDLCAADGRVITLRPGEREIDLIHAICIELHHFAEALGDDARRCVRRLCRDRYVNHRHPA